jgi:hypothetical protein
VRPCRARIARNRVRGAHDEHHRGCGSPAWTTGAARLAPPDLDALLGEIARIWHLEPAGVSQQATASIEPATRIACAGAGAMIALARAFHGRPELDLANQVTLIADAAGTRQLFDLAIAALGGARAGQRSVRILATSPRASWCLGVAGRQEPHRHRGRLPHGQARPAPRS